MHCSRSLTVHLLRGLGAAGLLFAAALPDLLPLLLQLACGAGAVLLMRGCPMCWLAGLVETLSRRAPKARASSPSSPP